MSDLDRLVSLAEAGELDELEDAWLETVLEPPDDLSTHLGVARTLAEVGEGQRAGVLLGFLVDPLLEAERWADALEVARRVGRMAPRSFEVRPAMVEALQGLHADNPLLEPALHFAGLERSTILEVAGERIPLREGPAVMEGLEEFETYLRFSIGEHVHHPASWGTGRVVDATKRGELVIDLEGKKGHRMPLTSAMDFLDPIPPDDFRALRFSKPDELRAMAADEPLELLRLAIEHRGGSTGARKAREDLADLVDDWKSWWRKTRREALRDPFFEIESGSRGAIRVRETPVTLATEMAERIEEEADDLAEAARLVRRFDREAKDEDRTPVVEALAREAAGASREDPPPGLVDALVILEGAEDDASTVRAIIGTSPHDLLRELVRPAERADEEPGPADRDRLTTLLHGASVPRFRNRILEVSREVWPEAWPRLQGQVLLDRPDLWKEIAPAIAEADPEAHAALLDEVAADPIGVPGAFLEVAREVLAGEAPDVDLDPEEVPERLIGVLEVLQLDARTGDPVRARKLIGRARDILGPALMRRLEEGSDDEVRHIWQRVERSDVLGHELWRDARAYLRDERPAILAEPTPPFWEDEEAIFSTREGIEKLEAEFHELVQVKMPANAKAIGDAADFGDLSENAEWTAALEERDQLAQKIAKMKEQLEKVRPLESVELPEGVVAPGTRVIVREVEEESETTYTILGPWDADLEAGVISYTAPLAKGFLGHEPGETVDVSLPDEDFTYEIRRIERIV